MRKILLILLVISLSLLALSACIGADNNDPCQDGHSYTNYKSDNNATCTADGTKTAKCENCDATDTVTDEGTKKNHTFPEDGYVSDGNATCTADGTKTAKCENCDATDTVTDEGTKKNHTFPEDGYVSDGNATCTADGTKTAKCENCDATDTVTDEGTKKNHIFPEDGYVSDGNATCTADGTKTAKCENCDATNTLADAGSMLSHNKDITEIIKNPTCTDKGEKKLKCSSCPYFVTEEIPALGHSYDQTVWGYKGEDGHAHRCACGAYDSKNLVEHIPDRSEATEEHPKLCTECGYTIEPIKNHEHNYNIKDAVSSAIKKPASCTNAAEYYYTCSCGRNGSESFTHGEPLAHDFNAATCDKPKTCKNCPATEGEPTGNHDYDAATCTLAKTCKSCGVTDGEPNGHDWKDATCTLAKKCDVCGVTEGEPIAHDCTEATCTEAKACKYCNYTEGDPLGHDWKDATCLAPKTCDRCKITEGEKVDHDWVPASCTAPKTCSVCKLTDGEALGHDLHEADWYVFKPATETEKGEKRRECRREDCDYYERNDIPSAAAGPGGNIDSGGWTPIGP